MRRVEIDTDEGFLAFSGDLDHYAGDCCSASTDWSQGGPIIEREKIRLNYGVGEEGFYCEAYITAGTCQHGPTPLTAAMRCYVASKLGDKVDVPEELSC